MTKEQTLATRIEGAIAYELYQMMGSPVYDDLYVLPKSDGKYRLYVTFPIGFRSEPDTHDVPGSHTTESRTEHRDFKYTADWMFMPDLIAWVDDALKEADEENDLDDFEDDFEED